MEKISVIVPVYNVENYLKESIESVINQTYKSLEIIIVDDGSTDNSGKICDEYVSKDSRIKVVHQENKGLSGARNTGLEIATGKYIMFLDSDDTFELDACEKLYNYIEKTNADYVVGNYINMDEDGTIWDKPVFDPNKYVEFKLSIEDYTHSFYTMNSGVWNKIFRKSFLDELQVRFVERVPAEDAFSQYDKIFERLNKEDKDTLILMALGPTATVLAYDLAKEGHQALDLGHFDIEYEWYRRNATKKEKIENKYTNEVSNGNETEEVLDTSYTSQIDTIIG